MKRWNPRSPSTVNGSRRGFVLVAVMICLLLISLLGAASLKLALAQYRQTEVQQSKIQSVWLAEAGINRAVAMLRHDPKYTGETWTIDASDFDGKQSAEVRIRITPDAEQKTRHLVHVVATFARDTVRRTRTTKQVLVDQ